MVRQLDKGLDANAGDRRWLEMAKRVLKQKKGDSQKVYSLHEPEVYCLSKGKEHKKYEFGAKASLVVGKTHGVILVRRKNDRLRLGAVETEDHHRAFGSFAFQFAELRACRDDLIVQCTVRRSSLRTLFQLSDQTQCILRLVVRFSNKRG